MAIYHESFSTSLHEWAFLMITMDDGRAGKKTRSWASRLRWWWGNQPLGESGGNDWASTFFVLHRASGKLYDTWCHRSKWKRDFFIVFSFVVTSRAAHPALTMGCASCNFCVLERYREDENFYWMLVVIHKSIKIFWLACKSSKRYGLGWISPCSATAHDNKNLINMDPTHTIDCKMYIPWKMPTSSHAADKPLGTAVSQLIPYYQ